MKLSLKLVTLMVCLASMAMAGVVFEVETKDHDQSPVKSTAWVENGNLKMGIPSARSKQSGTVIYRGDRREMVVVDHERKSYMVIDAAMIKSVAGQVDMAMNRMQDMLKNVPESQRAAIEKMMKEKMPVQSKPKRPKDTMTKTGERAKVNGYPCVKYIASRGDRKTREIWVTDWDNIEGGDEAVEAFEGLSDFFEEIMKFGDSSSMGSMSDNLFAHLKELNGFPVSTKDFGEDGSLDSESNLRSAKRTRLDPAEFEPPSGYKRRSMPGRR